MKKMGICLTFLVILCFPISVMAQVTLRWDANSAPDLAGYKLYYKIDGVGPPYNGTGADQGDSPIDVGNVTEFTITGLPGLTPPARYRFSVTAYDNEETDPPGGLESGFSNEVDTDGSPPVTENLRIVAQDQ